MPQTISYKTASEEGEYEAASDDEVAAMVAALDAASDALEAQKIALGPEPEYKSPYPRREGQPEPDNSAHEAYKAALAPYESRLREAKIDLSQSRNIPVGTRVFFSSTEGWYDSTNDEGVITKVTPTSYIVTKDYEGTSRISRENGHLYRSSYSTSNGGRNLHVVRTVRMEQAYQAQQAQARAEMARQRAAQQDRYAAEQRLREALGTQQALLEDAKTRALRVLLSRHAEEFASLERAALELLVLDDKVPGREETAPLPETT